MHKDDNAEQRVHNVQQKVHNIDQHDDNLLQGDINTAQGQRNDDQEVVNVAQIVFNNEIRRYVKRALIGYLILAAAISVGFFAFYQVRTTNYEKLNIINERQCNSIGNLYEVIRSSIDKNDAQIDQIEYYKLHPAEAEAAHAANAAVRKQFKTPACPRDITLTP